MFNTDGLEPIKDRPRRGTPEVWRYYDEYGAMQGRTCVRCEEDKPVSEFYEAPKTADGYGSTCRPCTSADRKTRRTLEKLKKMERAFGPRAGRNIS